MEGLPSGGQWGMFKDTMGYLWLYGEQGVARFDGYNFKVFRHNPDDSTSIPSNSCNGAMLMVNGDIYFNLTGRFLLYDPRKLSFARPVSYNDEDMVFNYSFILKNDKNALYHFSFNNLIRVSNSKCDYFPLPETWDHQNANAASDSSNLIMLNVWGKVFVFKTNTKSFDQIKIYDRAGNPDTTVFSIMFSAEEKNFIAISKKHLYRLNKNSDSFIPNLDLQQLSFVGQLNDFRNSKSILYLNYFFTFTREGNLYKLNIKTGEEKIIYLNKKIPEQEITDKSISGVIDKNGILWISSMNMGLFRYDIQSDRYEQFIHEPGNPGSIPSNNVRTIVPDDNGMAWIGCGVYGLVKMEPVLPVMERLSPDANKKKIVFGGDPKNVRTFLETETGYLVGTLQGLFSYDESKKEFSEIAGRFRQVPTNVSVLSRDGSGNIWSGTWGGWISIANPKNNKYLTFDRQIGETQVRIMFCDSKNTMWIGTGQGKVFTVNVNEIDFDNPASVKFNPVYYKQNNASNISNDYVFTIIEDPDGNMWVGDGNGLNFFNRIAKKWIHYSNIPGDKNSIHGNDVRSLAFDKKGTLWIGTNGGGLNRYNKSENNFTHFTAENGLPNDVIYTILCDNNGMLWLGTNHGLCRFNPNDYSVKNFTLKDGIQNYEFNTNAALKLTDGRLLFGGVDGYNVIDPAKIENAKTLPPSVVISSIKIFDREVPPGDDYLKLKYTENSLTFEFAALSFYRNQDNRYAYKMEGIDPDWIYSSDRRFVTYSNLEQGDYIFKVKACNSDGVWNETGVQISITITPPWWETVWFRSLMLVVVVSGVVLFLRNRTASFRKQKLILESTVEERTADLREQKEISEQQRIRAEQSEKFKQQFLANMSHEIRTPMNAVMGMTGLLIEKNPRSDQFNYLDGIKKSSDNLLHIINDILDLSKVEAGKMELEKIDFSLRDMIEQVKQILNYKAEEKGLELITDIDFTIPDVLIGDPTRINQVLINLTGNAIKFTEKGSVTISVSSRQLAVDNSETSNAKFQTLNFSIIDTGIGIPKDKLQTVFESFSQANASDTRIHGGTGLGLSISKQLVELMGGKIFIESEEGAGTIFSFEINLPVGSMERMQEQKSSEQIDGSILNGLKVLIVDDNEYNRVVVHDTLKLMADVEIFQATNGQEAIDAVCQYEFDIILMDVQMPLMNGYEATMYIREKMHAPKNAIPVIALTASVIRSDLDKCRAAGMNDYVPKPFKKAQLISAIARATGREMKFTTKKTDAVDREKENHYSVSNLSYLEKFVLIEKLNTALLNNDLEEIASQVHGFKTKWIMMGMTESKALAQILEQQYRGKEQDISVKENVLKLMEQIQVAIMELT
ncbi:MAG: response regulator [Bacteroidetes bacterium]|nr:response regulator [Bacteroidota bacterium]